MFPVDRDTLDKLMSELGIADITKATIRQIVSLSGRLESIAGEPCVHLELGNPGIPASSIGIEAECEALRNGIPGRYPDIAGLPALKEAGSRFIKAFLGVDIPSHCIVPTVGSMQGSFTMMMLLKQRQPGRHSMLFLDPGFPAQHHQAKMLGLKEVSFDIYDYRGDKLEAKLEEVLSKGDVCGMLYSSPNNPAWTNLTEQELEIIGRMATKYDVIVLEDLAYFGMDFRRDFGKPNQEPYMPTVARYTDNYVLLMSASKIFSYAGQRIAIAAMGPKVFSREYKALKDFYGVAAFGNAYVFGVLYGASSGTAHSAQYALAAMMNAAADGKLNFVEDCREYERRGKRARKAFADGGFHLVYEKDGDETISNGFFFTAGYGNLSGGELQYRLLSHGVATISLPSTGSLQEGVRVCASMLKDDAVFEMLERRLRVFSDEN